jgi:cyclic pyranopterin phosphate synthase
VNPPAPDPPPSLTHVDEAGQARMVDVGAKPATERRAVAQAVVRVSAPTAHAVLAGDAPKGDVLGVARIAGIQAAKRTSELVPLCHPLALSFVGVEASVELDAAEIVLTAEARTVGPTGVEMEALTAASVAALTVYDMIKGIERGAEIASVRLLEKAGGKSGRWLRDD